MFFGVVCVLLLFGLLLLFTYLVGCAGWFLCWLLFCFGLGCSCLWFNYLLVFAVVASCFVCFVWLFCLLCCCLLGLLFAVWFFWRLVVDSLFCLFWFGLRFCLFDLFALIVCFGFMDCVILWRFLLCVFCLSLRFNIVVLYCILLCTLELCLVLFCYDCCSCLDYCFVCLFVICV